MTEREIKILNITSAILSVLILICIAIGILAFVLQRTPSLKPADYESQPVVEMTGTEPVEVTQNYQNFSVSAAEAS